MKKTCYTIIFLLALPVVQTNAQPSRRYPTLPPERPFWFVLEEGKKAFREGEYGAALALFEEARTERRARYARMETAFIALLSIGEVRRIGDNLEIIERYVTERNQFDAAAALEELYYRVGRGALGNSAKTALSYFGRLKEYPEAEFMIGEVYRLEGEFGIALSQYNKALEHNIEAESPLFSTEILYTMADVNRSGRNWRLMEEALERIMVVDKLWNSTGTFARTAMTRTLGTDGINSFLQMYRHKSGAAEKAHRLLGEFCYKSGRHNIAESHLAFAVLEQNTVIIDEALRNRFDFSFTTLNDLMAEISRRPEIKKYMQDVEYFKTLYYLGAVLYANGKSASARGIWTFLSSRADAGEWARRSQNQLRSPFVEALSYTN